MPTVLEANETEVTLSLGQKKLKVNVVPSGAKGITLCGKNGNS